MKLRILLKKEIYEGTKTAKYMKEEFNKNM
jgi:hypothetical protein